MGLMVRSLGLFLVSEELFKSSYLRELGFDFGVNRFFLFVMWGKIGRKLGRRRRFYWFR